MGRAELKDEGAVNHLPIYTNTTGSEQVASHRRVLHQPCLIKDGSNRHILCCGHNDLWKILRQFAFLHTVTRRTVSRRCCLFTMETRDDLFGELDLDVTGVSASLTISLERIDLFHRAEAEQFEVTPHQCVGNGNQLAVHDARGFLDADIVTQGFGHLLHAIQPLEQRHGQHALRLLTVGTLQLAPHQQVELLIGTTKLDVRAQGDRVIALHQRIKKLMDSDRLVRLVTLVEIIALEHARYGVLGGQANEISRTELIHPSGVESHFGLGRIENLENLRLVGLGVVQDLLASQRRASSALAARITDHSGEVADQEDHLVTQILKLAQLINKHRMPQVQIGRRRIETGLDAQWLPALKLGDQFRLDQEFIRAALYQRQLLFNRLHNRPVSLISKGNNHTRSPPKYKICPQKDDESGNDPYAGLPQAGFGYILYSYFIFIMSFIFSISSFFKVKITYER